MAYSTQAGEQEKHPFLTPAHADEAIRSAVQMCWLMLPPEKRTVEEVEKQIRRLVDRALQNFQEDQQAFVA